MGFQALMLWQVQAQNTNWLRKTSKRQLVHRTKSFALGSFGCRHKGTDSEIRAMETGEKKLAWSLLNVVMLKLKYDRAKCFCDFLESLGKTGISIWICTLMWPNLQI